MQIVLERRAEIALRSLGSTERKQIARSLELLSEADLPMLMGSHRIRKLATGFSAKSLFVYRGSPTLRLVLSFENDVCKIEDIVDHDRLDRPAFSGGRQ
jgi:hypothetical protein